MRGVSVLVGVATCSLAWACLGILHWGSQPSTVAGELKPGADLSQGWWVYLFDVIYVAAFAQLGSLISGWFHLVFLAIPGYAIYAALGFLQGLSQMMPAQQQQAAQAPNPKDRRKFRVVR